MQGDYYPEFEALNNSTFTMESPISFTIFQHFEKRLKYIEMHIDLILENQKIIMELLEK